MTIISFNRPQIDFTGKDVHYFIAMRNQPIGYQVVVPVAGEITWDVAPFGSVTIDGDVEEALPHLLAWIDPKAICIDELTWRQAIADNLREGLPVDLDTLPEGVLRNPKFASPVASATNYAGGADADIVEEDLPRGWTHASMMDAAACARLEQRTRGRIDRW